MVTTDEDNVVKGTVTRSDILGNITTYVETGVERVEDVVSGREARRRSVLWPMLLLLLIATALIGGYVLGGMLALIALSFWVIGASR